MINQDDFISLLKKENIEFFTGVPDSFLNGFCDYLVKNVPEENNVITANEGNAIGVAAGYYFSTGKMPLVYMQNSGLGNAMNPLVSLADKDVYSVPMVLIIGWRGQEGVEPNHPQHKRQGAILLDLLSTMEIPYVIPNGGEDIEDKTRRIIEIARKRKTPVAIVVKKGVFSNLEKINKTDNCYPLSREEAIETLLDSFPQDTIYTATTGRTTRELYFLREKRAEDHCTDYLNLGAMGHASSVAFGIAMNCPSRKVVCLDGDAAAIMHMGAFTMMGKYTLPNMLHVVLNNGVHESVGGQPSAGYRIDMTKIAEGAGYATIGHSVSTKEEIKCAIEELENCKTAAFLEIRIHKGMRGELPGLCISTKNVISELESELAKESM